MKLPSTKEELTNLFRQLGARDPEAWASSPIEEGIPQLQRFLWLREAWKLVVPDDNLDWIDAEIKYAETRLEDPYAGVGVALKRCLEKGVERETLKEVVRGMQAQFLFGLSYMLEDPSFPESEVKTLSWGLFETDEDGNPLVHIGGLHESVLETDSTGTEMRPAKPA